MTARRYLEDGLAELRCEECGATVRVRKHSQAQTSVQWSVPAAARCAELALHRALGEPSALVRTCATLRASIEHALADGRLHVTPPDGTPVEPAPRGAPPGGVGEDEHTLEREALDLATAGAHHEETT